MNDKGYQVLIDNAYPYYFAFDKRVALEVARHLNPKALSLIKRHYDEAKSEPLSSSQLAHALASCDIRNKRPKRERIELIRKELSDYWETRQRLSIQETKKRRRTISHD